MSTKTTIEWTRNDDGSAGRTWNPVSGCTKVSPGCDHCLAPDARVLRADMTWVPIKDIKTGDKLVSFTDAPALGQNRVWEEAEVLATWEVEKPTVQIDLANGATFTASEDHKWLVSKRSSEKWWRPTISLSFKTKLRTVRCNPTDTTSNDYRAGYIAGATAGDGTFRWDPSWNTRDPGHQVYWRVAKPEHDRVVLERLTEYLAGFGVEVSVRPFDGGRSGFTDSPLPMAKVETRKRTSLSTIASLCERSATREFMTGWLAGMFDTDGSYTGGNLRFHQIKDNDVLDRVVLYGKELDFEFHREDYAPCPGARLVGGIPKNIAFLGAISPALTRRCRDFYGHRVDTEDVAVTGIRRGPVQTLIDITTSTGTFIAEGALTHNCYAEGIARRFAGTKAFPNGFDVTLRPERLNDPLKWRKPTRVFVNSMSDLFHKDVSDSFIAQVFAVMAQAPQHQFQILTKRHARMRSLVGDLLDGGQNLIEAAPDEETAQVLYDAPWPLPNVLLGVSVENQQWADIRIPALMETAAATRFLSCEPLLGPVDLSRWLGVEYGETAEIWIPEMFAALNDRVGPAGGLHWVIAGAESGRGARSMDLAWVRTLRDQCEASGTAFFLKQDAVNGKKVPTPELDGRTWTQMPDLAVAR